MNLSKDNVRAIVPAMNEEAHIADVVARVLAQQVSVLVVDDGSSDATADVARNAGAEVLRHETNLGKGAALSNGIEHALAAGAQAVLLLDADGQHAPEEIPAFLDALREADVVIGTRMQKRQSMPLIRWWTNRYMSHVLSRRCGIKITDTQSGYRALSAKAWRAVEIKSKKFDMESEMLIKFCRAGLKIAEVPIQTIYGNEQSHINPVKDAFRWLRMLKRLGR